MKIMKRKTEPKQKNGHMYRALQPFMFDTYYTGPDNFLHIELSVKINAYFLSANLLLRL